MTRLGLPIPRLLGFLGIGLPKWLTDPYGYIRDKLNDLYNGLGHYVEVWIINPAHPVPGSWLNYMYGNAAGLAIYLIGVVGFLCLILMVVSRVFAFRAAKAAIILVIIYGLYPVWFAAGNWFVDAGNSFTNAVAGQPAANSQFLLLPQINNVFGDIAGIFFLLLFGGTLLVIMYGYAILLILALLIGLPLLALYPMGDGFRRKFEQIVGIVIVTSFFGRLAAVAILRLTMAVIDHMPLGNSAFGSVLTLIAGFGLAIVAQFFILKYADKIYGNITGRTLGTSRVTGYVETKRRERHDDMTMAKIQNARIASVTSAPAISPVATQMSASVPASVVPNEPNSTDFAEKSWTAFRRRKGE